MSESQKRPQRGGELRLSLTGRFFFGRRRCLATVFFGSLRVSGLLTGHVARVVMELAIQMLAGLLLIRVFVVCHADPSRESDYRSSAVACFEVASGLFGDYLNL
jgi:hypothetical protein